MRKWDKALFHISQSVRWARRVYGKRRGVARPIHIVFCMVDHYEPGTGGVDVPTEIARVDLLLERYPLLARERRDADGRIPRRTWFFPPHYHRNGNLLKLVQLCAQGYGEIELHLHHGERLPDTETNLEATIRACISDYSEFGIFGEKDGAKRYGFIHGKAALANSRGGKYCGVNNEIDVLRRTGCYADFSHPSGPVTSPARGNEIFYARASDCRPKSYDYGALAKVGPRPEGLLIVQGPSHPALIPASLGLIRIVGDHVPDTQISTTPARVTKWVRTGICVDERRDVVFIKVSTHGAPFAHSVLGEDASLIFNELESRFNDGEDYRLHYVTARELFNLVRAIEDGRFLASDILSSLNYEVSEPRYDTSCTIHEASLTLQELVARTYW